VANTRHPRLESSSVVASPKPDEVPVIMAVRMISLLDLDSMVCRIWRHAKRLLASLVKTLIFERRFHENLATAEMMLAASWTALDSEAKDLITNK
jgi:hypothetical protein